MGEYFPSVGQTDAFSRQPLPYDSVHPSEGVEAGFNQQPTEVDNLRDNILNSCRTPRQYITQFTNVLKLTDVSTSLKFRLFYYRKITPIALACILLLTAYRNQKMFRPRRKAECSTRNIRRRNSHTIYLAEI